MSALEPVTGTYNITSAPDRLTVTFGPQLSSAIWGGGTLGGRGPAREITTNRPLKVPPSAKSPVSVSCLPGQNIYLHRFLPPVSSVTRCLKDEHFLPLAYYPKKQN